MAPNARFAAGRRGLTGALVPLLALALLNGACTALVVGGAGNSTTYPPAQTEEARAADLRTTERVRASLAADAELRQAEISVATHDGVVTLSGKVADYKARAQAEMLTAGVNGVRGINNRLKVSAGR